MPNLLTSLLPALAALAAVLGLVVLAGRAARLTGLFRLTGLSRRGTNTRLAVQETLVLDRARRLLLVRCDGRDMVLLTGGGHDVVVGWLPGDGAVP